jgi:hypothetical protein
MALSYDDKLVVIYLSSVFLFRATIMFMILFIYLHALHFVINVMSLCVYMFCT